MLSSELLIMNSPEHSATSEVNLSTHTHCSSGTLSNSQLDCKNCEASFDTRAKLKYHRLKNHGKWKETLKCEKCQKSYGTLSNLRKHMKLVHDKVKGIQCELCSFQTIDAHNMKIHKLTHSGPKPFDCQKCSFRCARKYDLQKHQKNCKGAIYKCLKCEETFHFKNKLTDHLSWSDQCGSIPQHVGTEVPKESSMVRLNTKDTFMLAINCEQLADTNVYNKKKKKVNCGLCLGCSTTENCHKCNACKGLTKRTKCVQRRCSNLIVQYDIKKGQEGNILLPLDSNNCVDQEIIT